MNKKEIKFRDPVVERVVDKFIDRSDVGFKKYKVTLEDDHSDIFAWINHLQEELMDAILYIQAAREELKDQAVVDAISSAQLDFNDKNSGLPYYVTDVAS